MPWVALLSTSSWLLSGALASVIAEDGTAEVRLRRQVAELTVLLEKSRSVATGLSARVAALSVDPSINSRSLAILSDIAPDVAQALIDVAQAEERVDRIEEVVNARERDDGSDEAKAAVIELRKAHLAKDDSWVRGTRFLGLRLSNRDGPVK